MILERESWPDVEEFLAENPTVLFPLGSTEQHGPHAPLVTDSLIAESLASAAEEDLPVLLAPAARITVSSHHGDFPGTLWVSPDTFRAYVRETIESFLSHGAENVVLVNGHGGNISSLDEVALGFNQSNEEVTVVPWTWFESVDDAVRDLFDEELNHADGPETSVVMYLNRELVHEDRLEEAQKQGARGWRDEIAGTSIPQNTKQFSRSGATGFPETADADRGEKLFQAAKANLVELARELGVN